ncbi:MAG: hypothetical protein Q8O89_00905 [Nanoarchaeota archaeon]|nr:hypothetical protein [Nanoarchaeota archaeon]
MKKLGMFEEYRKTGVVKRISVNTQRAKSLVEESERKKNSLQNMLEKLGVTNENANDYVEYCYDIMMHLVRAKMNLDGYSASGQRAHEAEVSYMRVLGFDEKDIEFADKLRYFRNGILYYGTALDKEYAEKVIVFTKKIYPKLKEIFK